jgi:hypothetical protein
MTAGAFADLIRPQYVAHQINWLRSRLGQQLDPALQYALTEFSDGKPDLIENWSRLEYPSELDRLLSRSKLLSEFGYAA